MVAEDMQGEVVMVRLGADDGGMDPDQDQVLGPSSFVELKPSATLLVPLELVEEQQSLVDDVQLGLQTFVPDDLRTETRSSFSLMLDMEEEEGDREAYALPMENDLQPSDLLSPAEEAHGEHVDKPEVVLFDTDHLGCPQFGDPLQEDQGKETDSLDGAVIDGLTESEPAELPEHLQAENSEANQDTAEKKDTELVMLAEDHEAAAPVDGLQAAVTENDSAAKRDAAGEEMEDKHPPTKPQEEPETNGPVGVNAENVPSAEAAPAVEEQQQDPTASEGAEETAVEKPNMKTRGRKHVEDTDNQPEEPSVPETPTSQKKAPFTPTRMTTRGRRTVTFISPLPEEQTEEKKGGDAETSVVVPASPSRTPRKTKPIKEAKVQPSPPRRSTRKAQPEPPKEEDAVDKDATSTSKASSPARKRVSTRSSQSEEVSTSTEAEDGAGQQEVTDKKAAPGTKSPTPAKRRAAQENTPRRSRRRILSSSEVESTPKTILKEEEAFDPPVSRSSRKTKTEPPETEPARPGSPGRMTRQSNRISLNVYPQVSKRCSSSSRQPVACFSIHA